MTGNSDDPEQARSAPENVAYCEIDVENEVITWSLSAAHLHGKTTDDSLDIETIVSLYHKDDRPDLTCLLRTAISGKTNFQMDLRLAEDISPARQLRWTGVFRPSANGSSASFACFFQDITDSVRQSQDLQIKPDLPDQTRLFDALEHISDGYVLYDSDLNLVHCNPRYREFYHWIEDVLVPGTSLETIARSAVERGISAENIPNPDLWIQGRMEKFRKSIDGYTQVLSDGRILLCSDSRTSDGSYVGTRTDITRLKKAEEELIASQSRYQRLFDTAIISQWDEDFSEVGRELGILRDNGVSDLAGYLAQNIDEAFRLAGLVKINAVNDATIKMYGATSKSEFISQLSEIMTDETINVFVGVLIAIWNNEESYATEATHLTFDGREITIYMSFPIPRSEADWKNVPICIFDVTDQKKLELELRDYQSQLASKVEERTQDLQVSEERVRDLIDGSLQGIMVHRGLKPLFINDALANIFGYTVKEFMAMESIRSFVDADDLSRLAKYEYQRAHNGEAPEIYEFKGRKKDGSSIWLMSRVRQVNWDGETASQISVVDITERKLAEQALSDSERMHRNILETSPIGMGVTNAKDGVADFVNDAHLKMLGVTREEFLSTPGADFWTDANGREKFAEAFHTNEITSGEVQLKRKDGTSVWTIQRWAKSPSVEGEILFWSYDISELKEAKDIAHAASLAKTVFLSAMSHELRTPLNAILGFGQLLEFSPDDPLSEDNQDSVERIMNAGRHLLVLVNDILDMAKIETGSMSVHIEDVSPLEALEYCLAFIEGEAKQRGLSISDVKQEELGLIVRADSTRLKQVLLNLLSNAVKYNEQGGRIDLSLKKSGHDQLRFSVSDTGKGISEEDISNLFKPFNRIGAENSDIEGTGIGLAITKNLVELMNGSIGVDSVVGEGTTFWFELPLAPPDPSAL